MKLGRKNPDALNILFKIFLLVVVLSLLQGCKKFLDQKINKTDVVPTTLSDLQSLLDADVVINSVGIPDAEVLADNYYMTTARWQTLVGAQINDAQIYIWAANIPPDFNNWDVQYENPIYYSNVVLDQLSQVEVDPGQGDEFNSIKGSALFIRAYNFQRLAQLYCKPYSTSSANDLGIVLKLTSNVSEAVKRATVQQTYDQIVSDLKQAANLLPVTTSFPTRPSKVAAFAILARTYLSMRDYVNAGNYADSALSLYSTLIDYNTLVPVGSPPVKTFNAEVIYQNYCGSGSGLSANGARIDTTLFQSYNINDLRRTVFFKPGTGANVGTYSFRGSYNGNYNITSVFDGPTTGEMYLTRAECFARAGNVSAAIGDLNSLMSNRWVAGLFTPITAIDATDALNKVLTERRKELVYRGLRWTDIRRLNLEGANITLTRIIAGTTYTLPPNDLRTVALIPFNQISFSGIQQNPR